MTCPCGRVVTVSVTPSRFTTSQTRFGEMLLQYPSGYMIVMRSPGAHVTHAPSFAVSCCSGTGVVIDHDCGLVGDALRLTRAHSLVDRRGGALLTSFLAAGAAIDGLGDEVRQDLLVTLRSEATHDLDNVEGRLRRGPLDRRRLRLLGSLRGLRGLGRLRRLGSLGRLLERRLGGVGTGIGVFGHCLSFFSLGRRALYSYIVTHVGGFYNPIQSVCSRLNSSPVYFFEVNTSYPVLVCNLTSLLYPGYPGFTRGQGHVGTVIWITNPDSLKKSDTCHPGASRGPMHVWHMVSC